MPSTTSNNANLSFMLFCLHFAKGRIRICSICECMSVLVCKCGSLLPILPTKPKPLYSLLSQLTITRLHTSQSCCFFTDAVVVIVVVDVVDAGCPNCRALCVKYDPNVCSYRQNLPPTSSMPTPPPSYMKCVVYPQRVWQMAITQTHTHIQTYP